MQVDLFVNNLKNISKYFNIKFRVGIEINDGFYDESLNVDKYMIALRKSRQIDKIVGGTKVGPHKSDYIFFVDENFLASQLSTGQQKTLVLLLYFSQCNYLVNTCKKSPILLLDEISAHLDERRRSSLFELLQNLESQIWMTGTERVAFSDILKTAEVYNISEGKIV